MTEVTALDISRMVKTPSTKKRSASSLDASGSTGNGVGTPMVAHAQTHQHESVPPRDRTPSVSKHHNKSTSQHQPMAHPERTMAPLDTPMETNPTRPMGDLAMAATTAATGGHRSGGGVGGVSKTKMQKHLQMLRRHGVVTEPVQPGVPIQGPLMMGTPSPPSSSSWKQLWSPNRMSSEDHEVVRELDQDVAGALVAVGGTLMGIPAQDLLHSPAMRKLVARNIRWFQGTHDIVKLVGLMAAKKLNQWVSKTCMQTTNISSDLKEEDGVQPPPLKKTRYPLLPPRICTQHKSEDEDAPTGVELLVNADTNTSWSEAANRTDEEQPKNPKTTVTLPSRKRPRDQRRSTKKEEADETTKPEGDTTTTTTNQDNHNPVTIPE